MSDKQIWYEPHPVTPERKAELRAKGFTILDAAFMPADHVQEDDAGEKGDDSNGDGKLSVAEIRESLTKRGIQFNSNAKKADLLALLEDAQ